MPNSLHDRVLDLLLEYRKSNPEFKFWLRQRDRNNRLTDGLWFQGTDGYAFVGLYNRGGGTNMTRSFGIVFWEANDGTLAANIEIVWNEEKDKSVIAFYQKSMDLLGDFEQDTTTKYRKYLAPHNAENVVIEFLNNSKPKIDQLIKQSGLSEMLFLDEQRFEEQLNRVVTIRNQPHKAMLNKKLIAEIKELFENFKLTEQYDNRKLQVAFIPFAKELIEQLLQKDEITNLDLTGLIQVLKANSNDTMAHRYIPQMFTDEKVAESLLNRFEGLDYKGYTGAGKSGIAKPNKDELAAIKGFLARAFTVKAVDQAVALCDEYDTLNIPEVKKGIYSPWLFYINPTLFPIINTKHLQFLDWVGVSHKYSDSITLYNELETILDTDMGLLDAFIYFMKFDDTIEFNPSVMPLNTILYGPPGTGKTFDTINKAVAIANPDFDVWNTSREELKQEYQRLVDDKQIEFITFHQSLSYEDFIEGIKPVLLNADDEELPEHGSIHYKIEPGIFYRLCKQASVLII